MVGKLYAQYVKYKIVSPYKKKCFSLCPLHIKSENTLGGSLTVD